MASLRSDLGVKSRVLKQAPQRQSTALLYQLHDLLHHRIARKTMRWRSLQLAELVFAANLHCHLGRQLGVNRCREQIVERCQHRAPTLVQQRKILAMRIMVANQRIEDQQA